MRWSYLPRRLQTKFGQDILNSLGNEGIEPSQKVWLGSSRFLNQEEAFSELVRSCIVLGYKWQTNQPLRERIFSTFCRCFHQKSITRTNFVNSVVHFGLVHLKWVDLPVAVKDTIFEGIKQLTDRNAWGEVPFLLSGLLKML
jgi:hypothetical protein